MLISYQWSSYQPLLIASLRYCSHTVRKSRATTPSPHEWPILANSTAARGIVIPKCGETKFPYGNTRPRNDHPSPSSQTLLTQELGKSPAGAGIAPNIEVTVAQVIDVALPVIAWLHCPQLW